MHGHQQEVLRKQTEEHAIQDLEQRLAEIYAGIEGGEDVSDLTAPRGVFAVPGWVQRVCCL